jgi:hypothetical protein
LQACLFVVQVLVPGTFALVGFVGRLAFFLGQLPCVRWVLVGGSLFVFFVTAEIPGRLGSGRPGISFAQLVG